MGPTTVAYLCGAGARAARTLEATTTSVTSGMVGALWLTEPAAVGAAAASTEGGGAATMVAGLGLGLDPPAEGGEERCT